MQDDTPKSVARLLAGLIDYAGLFPPATLPMADAVERYARYRQGAHAWALGRFIVPAARLEEFARELGRLQPTSVGSPWPLSVLADSPLGPLNRLTSSAAAAGARVESVECRVASPDDLREAALAARGFELFAEVPADPVPEHLLAMASAVGAAVKIRTGGTSPEAFPPSSVVAAFLSACVERRVPFKATAGLHHPVRSAHPLTDEPGAPSTTMHGFLNVFLAAALLYAGPVGRRTTERLLEETNPSAFVFDDGRAGWRDRWVTTEGLEGARRLARSFGSCSFEEPIEELASLALLHTATT